MDRQKEERWSWQSETVFICPIDVLNRLLSGGMRGEFFQLAGMRDVEVSETKKKGKADLLTFRSSGILFFCLKINVP